MDDGDAAILVLLDLSAAFDTIDHHLLLQRLREELHIHGAALDWIQSYLSDREQCVVVSDAVSEPRPLTIGVPQGSVIGPLLFTLYMTPLRKILQKYNIFRHAYADDTQLYCCIL